LPFATADTIVAIATPSGRGGIGVVRLSGPEAHSIARALVGREAALEPRHATVATVRPIDRVVLTYFPSPASYTGDDVVEMSAHGSPVVLKSIVKAAIDAGARLAEPGEFTLRAFVNGRIDLMQAEAVGDLIDAVTPLQARAAFDQLQGTLTRAIAEVDAAVFDLIARLEASVDFPDEAYHFVEPGTLATAIDGIIGRVRRLLAGAKRGRLVREGLQIAIVGEPNVGKSSLFNALAGAERAIVTDVPGTTRDLITETIDLGGLRVTLVDTAGLRETVDVVESEGVRRSGAAADVADLVLVVVDGAKAAGESERLARARASDKKAMVVSNKSDLGFVEDGRGNAARVSALTGEGLDELRARILDALDLPDGDLREGPEMTNVRHIALVERAEAALVRARRASLEDGGSMPEEFVLADLQDARAALEEVTGKRAPEDLLAHIFGKFCIGK
jgi:tRNA modification GTPase